MLLLTEKFMKNIFFAIGMFLLGFTFCSLVKIIPVKADDSCAISQNDLNLIYNLAFHRNPDSGAQGYVGQGLDFTLNQLSQSPENTYYSSVYSAVKTLETDQRAGSASFQIGSLYDNISNAIQEVSNWANPDSSVSPIYMVHSSVTSTSATTASATPSQNSEIEDQYNLTLVESIIPAFGNLAADSDIISSDIQNENYDGVLTYSNMIQTSLSKDQNIYQSILNGNEPSYLVGINIPLSNSISDYNQGSSIIYNGIKNSNSSNIQTGINYLSEAISYSQQVAGITNKYCGSKTSVISCLSICPL